MGEGQPSPIKILRIHQIEEKFLKTRRFAVRRAVSKPQLAYRTGESKAQA